MDGWTDGGTVGVTDERTDGREALSIEERARWTDSQTDGRIYPLKKRFFASENSIL